MASMPKSNRTIRIMPENKATQTWAPLLATAGVLIDAARRSLVADVIARLMQAHLESSPKATFAAVAHGMRFVTDGVSGAGAPCFVEAKGAGVGEVYLFGGFAKKDGLLTAIGSANIASTRDESKGGLYITLAPDADVDAVYRVLAMHASVRGPVGYLSSMGAPTDLDAVAFDPATQPKVEAKADKLVKDPSAPKAKRAAKPMSQERIRKLAPECFDADGKVLRGGDETEAQAWEAAADVAKTNAADASKQASA